MANLSLFQAPKKVESRFRPEAELVLYPGDVSDFLATILDNSVSLIITFPTYNLGKDYEDRVSIELVERCVLALTNEGDWVFDPCAGVGTSLIAAIMQNRRAAGSEKEAGYI